MHGRSLTSKYIVLGLIVLGLMALFTAISFRLTNRIKGDVRRMNLAGRERMLSFEMAWSVTKAHSEQGDERARTLESLRETMALFEEVLHALKSGSAKYGLAPLPHAELIGKNERLLEKWNGSIKPALLKAATDRSGAVRQYNAAIGDYVAEIDDFVKQIEDAYTKEIRFYGRLRLSVLGLAVLTFAGIILYVRHHLLRPIRILRDGVIAIGKGNLDVSVDVKTSDELGVLAYEFNKMTCDLRKLYRDLAHKNQRLIKLYGVAMSPTDDIPRIGDRITEAIGEVFKARAVSIVEVKGDEGRVVSMYQDRKIAAPEAFPLRGTPYEMVRLNKNYVYYDDVPERFPADPFFQKSSLTAYLGIPLLDISNGEVICILSVMDDRRLDFSQEDIEFLYTMGKKLALAMERKREEAEKKILERQLVQSQKMEALGTLSAGIAHDFNNMLTSIIGYGDLAQKQSSEPPVKEHIGMVLQAAKRAAGLTRQILLLGRKLPPERKPVDVNGLVDEAVKMLRHMVEENIEIALHLSSDLPLVQADPSQIGQALMNLVINARDAMPKGGAIRIRTDSLFADKEYCRRYAYAKPGRYVTVSVFDTGTGIPEDIRDRIFEPFFTTKEVGKGTGLGLAVTYSIVKNHGGWINLYSEMGKGSEFKIYLPAATSGDEAAAPDASKPEDLPQGTETVLIVDDEPTINDLGKSILQSLGYRAITTSNGEEALAIYKERGDEIALIILDRIMPKMDGIEAYRRLKEINPRVKVVLSSGYVADEASSLGEAGITGFLNKPYTVHDMARTVRKAIDGKQ